MANRGRHEFSVQEAVNMDSFVSWNYQEVVLTGDETAMKATYITPEDPAKKVVIYDKPGAATGFLEAGDVLSLTINGAAAPGIIKIDPTDLPFTLTGIMVTSLTITNHAGDTDDTVSVLSFH
tara:strand:- start:278 stop:643 length:366 start_codon:yes stop_codon:yes gene_type:complete